MFGGLTKTSSRIAIAAALGLVVGGFAFKATPARAADLGGDCCADLEERVAELEATTVRKGNKKVSVTLSGWVVKSFNWWDDGDIDSAYVGDKGYDLGYPLRHHRQRDDRSWMVGRLQFDRQRLVARSSPPAAPRWLPVSVLPISSAKAGSAAIRTRTARSTRSTRYIYIKSDRWGTLNWGHLSPASDNQVVLADISGTVIESNSVFFEGASFFLRPKGGKVGGFGGLDHGLTWDRLPALPGPWWRVWARTASARRSLRFATTHRPGAASRSRPLGASKKL